MATVFLESGRSTWSAKLRVWDASAGIWQWRKVSTGVKSKDAARAVAESLERASGEAKAGVMTREKAEGLVSSILHMAGIAWASPVPTLESFGSAFLAGRSGNVGEATSRKYAAHWSRLSAWAGERMALPLDRWTPEIVGSYYEDLRGRFSATTANDHLRTLAMIFLRAEAAGHIRGNPAALVERSGNDSVEKQILTRRDCPPFTRHERGARIDARMRALAAIDSARLAHGAPVAGTGEACDRSRIGEGAEDLRSCGS